MANPNNFFTILQWNVNSVHPRKAELMNLIKEHDPAVILLQETQLTKDKPFKIPNYDVIRRDRPPPNKGGGSLIAIKSRIPYSPITIPTHLEHTGVIIPTHPSSTTATNYPTLHIYNIYNSPTTNLDLSFINTSTNNHLIIAGDFNAHHSQWSAPRNDRNGKYLAQYIENHNLAPTNVKTNTYTKGPHSSLIDLTIISNTLLLLTDSYVKTLTYGSDHFPILTKVTFSAQADSIYNQSFNLNKADYLTYKHLLDIAFINPPNLNSVVDQYNFFINELIKAATATIPIRTNNPKHKRVPYWNDKCKEAIRKRNTAFNKYKKSKSISDIIDYKHNKAIAQKTISTERTSFWQAYCDTLDESSKLKSVWKMAKATSNKSNKSYIPHLKKGQDTIYDNLDKANLLAQQFADTSNNKNFSKKFLKRKNKFERKHSNVIPKIYQETEFLNDDIALHELNTAISSAKRNTCPGSDNIHYEFLKNLPRNAQKYLLNIFNELYRTSSFIPEWQNSVIIPILKPNQDPDSPLSYRPIALTSSICKTFEKILTKRLAYYLEKENLLNPAQAGFRKNRSTMDQLLRLHSASVNAINTGQYNRAIFLDFKKAFEMVWSEGLLFKLRKLKLHGKIYDFIKNFLSNRTIQVKIANSISNQFTTPNGVPQGSVISPLLFLIYINDLPTNNSNSEFSSLFADDSAIWQTGTNLKFITKKLQHRLDDIMKWSSKWGFNLNIDKTENIVFTRRKISVRNIPSLYINSKEIKLTPNPKFLGMIFDKTLSWNHHIEYIINKTKNAINLLRSLSAKNWGANKISQLKIYKTIIKPKITYGMELFSSISTTMQNKLDAIQYKCLKVVCSAPHSTALAALQNETGELPFHLEQKKLLLRHITRLKNAPNNPTNSVTLDSWHNYYSKPYSPSTYQQIENFLPIINQYNPPQALPSSPPWRFTPIKTDTFLCTVIDKSTTLPEKAKVETLEYLELYKNSTPIYTDGSKQSNQDTGAGIYFPQQNISLAIPIHSSNSIFNAELYAIAYALTTILNFNTPVSKTYAIYSDSLSAIKFLQNTNPQSYSDLQLQIYETYTNLTNLGFNISLIWIPSHIGIIGNEKADLLAKQASMQICQNTIAHYTQNEIYILLDKELLKIWQAYYNNLNNIKHYKSIEPTVSFQIKFFSKNKIKERLITRLRLGTAFTNRYLYKIKKHPSGHCDLCPQTTETISHFLLHCPHYSISESIVNPTLSTILSDPVQSDIIFNNIQKTNRKI